MWAKMITIKITKDLNYFSLCAFNLFYSRISQFELNYWNKWTFPRHSNLLRCTCICISWYFASLLKFNEFNLGCFQVYHFASVCIASCIVPIACSADRETVTEFSTQPPPPPKRWWMTVQHTLRLRLRLQTNAKIMERERERAVRHWLIN